MENLKFFRKKFNYTRKEFANKMMLDEHTIKLYELGNLTPSFKSFLKIIDIFKISFDYFILNMKCLYPRNIKLLELAKKIDDLHDSNIRNNIEATTTAFLNKNIEDKNNPINNNFFI